MGEIIDFKKATMGSTLNDNLSEECKQVARGLEHFKISDEDLQKVKEYMLLELKIMLGMCFLEEETISQIEPIFFDDIQDVYDQSNDYCYFCSDTVDANEETYGEFRRACIVCTLKLKNFLKAAGVEDISKIMKRAHRSMGVEMTGRC